jgi:O-antigen ligase
MSEARLSQLPRWRNYMSGAGLFAWLGVLLGVVVPLASALIYPTYVHQMPRPWQEWTRLMELPFIACELLVIHIALRRGMNDWELCKGLPRDVGIAFALLVVGVTVSSVLVSKNPVASVAISLFTLVHIRFAIAVYFLAREEEARELTPFMPLLGAGLAVLAVLTAWIFLLPPPASQVLGGKIEWSSALPGFISVRHFGSWAGAIAAGLMVQLLYPGGQERPRWLAPLYFLAAALTIWSGTRAALLAMAVVGLIMLVTLRRFPTGRAVRLAIILTLAAFVISQPLLPPGQPEFRLWVLDDGQSIDAATGGRMELWSAAFHKWLQAPVFGWGSGSMFWEVRVLEWNHTQPHNVILQFLISWGMVGAAGGLWLIGRAIAAVHRHGTAQAELRPLTGTLYSLLFMSLLEGMLHYPRFIMLIMVGFAVIMADRQRTLAGRAA